MKDTFIPMKSIVATVSFLIGAIILPCQALTPSEAVTPLVKPDLESAKAVINSLQIIGKDAPPEMKASAIALANGIKKVFTLEYGVQTSFAKLQRSFDEAAKFDQEGAEYLKPNALGSINEVSAEGKFKAANKIRIDALNEASTAVTTLEAGLKEFRNNFPQFQLQSDAATVIESAANSIEKRSVTSTKATWMAFYQRAQAGAGGAVEQVAKAEGEKQREKEDEQYVAKLMRIQRMAQREGDYMLAMKIANMIDNRHAGYLGNSSTKEVHHLAHETENCQIEKLKKSDNAKVFLSLEVAHAAGYDNCAYCIGHSER